MDLALIRSCLDDVENPDDTRQQGGVLIIAQQLAISIAECRWEEVDALLQVVEEKPGPTTQVVRALVQGVQHVRQRLIDDVRIPEVSLHSIIHHVSNLQNGSSLNQQALDGVADVIARALPKPIATPAHPELNDQKLPVLRITEEFVWDRFEGSDPLPQALVIPWSLIGETTTNLRICLEAGDDDWLSIMRAEESRLAQEKAQKA